MEQSTTSTRWKRYIRDVSANLCLIYISHLPLSYSVTINRTRNSFDPTYVEDQYVRPKGRFMDFKTISNNFWFSIEKWIARKYHTLLLYPFATYQAVNTSLYWFSFNIVPSTGILSYWIAYFAGSIGGGLGKVLEYYYSYYKLYQTRDERRKRFNFEQLAEQDLKQVFKDSSNDFEDTTPKKQAINPHDYIDDALLDKLFYTTNAKQPFFGPGLAINGLLGFSLALSGHYLYKQLKEGFQTLSSKDFNEEGNEIIDGIVSTDYDDSDDIGLWNEIKQTIYDLCSQIKGYITSSFTRTVYQIIVFGYCSFRTYVITYAYILQSIHKRNEKGGYGYLNAGSGIYGIDLGSVTSIFSGILVYPLVLKVREIWKWNKRLQTLKLQRLKQDNKQNNNNKQSDN